MSTFFYEKRKKYFLLKESDNISLGCARSMAGTEDLMIII